MLIGLVALQHIGTIMFYVHVKKDNVVRPMLTGSKDVGSHDPAEHARVGGLVVFVVVVAIAAAAVYGAGRTSLPAPTPAAAVGTPDW